MEVSKVIKKSGKEQGFNRLKIEKALNKANHSVDQPSQLTEEQFDKVMNTIIKRLEGFDIISTETIDDFVEMALTRHNRYAVLKAYEDERARKNSNKEFTTNEEKVLAIIDGDTEMRGDNANKNIDDNAGVRDYMAGTLAKSIGRKLISKVSKQIWKGHDKGWWHFHDLDYSPVNRLHNCDLINTEEMLSDKGFVMGNTMIEPHPTTKFRTACNLLSQINLQVSGRQYGGQTQSWAHLLPFVEHSRNNYRLELIKKYDSEEPVIKNIRRVLAAIGIKTGPYNAKKFHDDVERELRKEIKEGVKIYQYQVLCHSSSNGQTPFVSNNLCLREAQTQQELDDLAMIIEEIFKRRIEGVQDPSGHYISPLFPKLLYWTCDGLNVKEDDPYFYLTKLAAVCESVRMQPDIISEKQMRKVKSGQIIPTMGCRSLLAPIWEDTKYTLGNEFYWCYREESNNGQYPYNKFRPKATFVHLPNRTYKTGYEEGEILVNFRGNTGWLKEKTDEYIIISKPVVYGRWNNGVVTINLPHAALTAKDIAEKNNTNIIEEFYKILDKRLDVIRQALQLRYDSVSKIKGKNSAILWMHGALARMGAEDTVGDLMKKYSQRASMSLGFVGLYETCRVLIGESNTTLGGQQLSTEILKHLNDVCDKWKKEGYCTGEETIIKTDFELDE